VTTDKLEVPVSRRRAETAIYWIFAGLTLIFLVTFGVQDLLRTQAVSATILYLGYPLYFCYLLGAGKLLAAAALAYPKTRQLREWAYAGVTIELISASASHSFVRDAWSLRVAPLIFLAIVAVAYRFDWRRPQRS
jgi:hypothetical protein